MYAFTSILSLPWPITIYMYIRRPIRHLRRDRVTIIQITSGVPGKVVFRSNLLGGFGTGFVTPINTIDFNTLFDNIGQKLIDSACVWGTIIAILLLYVPFAVLARRLDKKDLFKVGLLTDRRLFKQFILT